VSFGRPDGGLQRVFNVLMGGLAVNEADTQGRMLRCG
jgi:hypothetical protein